MEDLRPMIERNEISQIQQKYDELLAQVAGLEAELEALKGDSKVRCPYCNGVMRRSQYSYICQNDNGACGYLYIAGKHSKRQSHRFAPTFNRTSFTHDLKTDKHLDNVKPGFERIFVCKIVKGKIVWVWSTPNPEGECLSMQEAESSVKVVNIERLAEAVHNAWWQEKIKQGYHAPADCPEWTEDDEPLCDYCHPDMLPYADLPENVKEYDRVTVRVVLEALNGTKA